MTRVRQTSVTPRAGIDAHVGSIFSVYLILWEGEGWHRLVPPGGSIHVAAAAATTVFCGGNCPTATVHGHFRYLTEVTIFFIYMVLSKITRALAKTTKKPHKKKLIRHINRTGGIENLDMLQNIGQKKQRNTEKDVDRNKKAINNFLLLRVPSVLFFFFVCLPESC